MGERTATEAKKPELVHPQAEPATSKSGSLMGPPKIDLGEVATNIRTSKSVTVWNTSSSLLEVGVHYAGDPSIVVDRAPSYLRTSREESASDAAIELFYVPTARGHHTGTLTVSASGQGVRESLVIPVEGTAHELGQPDTADVEAAERSRAATEVAEAKAAKESQDAAAARERRLDRNELPGSPGDRVRLEEATSDAREALQSVLDNRLAGVTTAENEVRNYTHHVVKNEPSLLEVLAFAALDAATAGIAGMVGKKLEVALMDVAKKEDVVATSLFTKGITIKQEVKVPSKVLVALYTDSVKDATKQAIKGQTSKLKAGSGHHHDQGNVEEPAGESTDPQIAFFQKERTALVAQKIGRAQETTTRARSVLEPMLATAPKQAIATMREIADAMRDLGGSNDTANVQATQSALHWTRYVAEQSLGTVEGDSARRGLVDNGPGFVANIDTANVAANTHGVITARDGLIDIAFEADPVRADQPAHVTGVRVFGVSRAIVDRVMKTLATAKLPIRAYCTTPGLAVEMIRDEVGNVRLVDGSGNGTWFQRRAGQPAGGQDLALHTARSLLNDLVQQAAATKTTDVDSDK